MEFPLTPHVKEILKGRGFCTPDGRLLCSATNCLFHVKSQPDPEFGREIEIKGYGICSRCNCKTDWEDGKEEDIANRKTILRCSTCKKIIPKKSIVWTQRVISRHRKSRHEYNHLECWNAKFRDVPNGDEDEPEEV